MANRTVQTYCRGCRSWVDEVHDFGKCPECKAPIFRFCSTCMPEKEKQALEAAADKLLFLSLGQPGKMALRSHVPRCMQTGGSKKDKYAWRKHALGKVHEPPEWDRVTMPKRFPRPRNTSID